MPGHDERTGVPHAKPSRNPRRSLDIGRRRAFRARSCHADRRRAAAAVVVSARGRGAGQHCRCGPCRRANLEIAQRAKLRMSRSTCVMPSSSAAASAICGSMASGSPMMWDAIAGIYKTRDRRFVRLHTNFPHHRDAVCKVLNCKPERDDVQAALMQWDAEAFETAAYAGGCVVAMMRSHEEWSATAPRQGARCAAADHDRKDRRGRAKTLAQIRPRRSVRSQACACSICRG